MVGHDVVGLGGPEGREAIKHLSFAGDARGKDMMEGRDTVCGYDKKPVTKVVDIPDFPPAKEGVGQIRFQEDPYPVLSPGDGKYHPRI